MNITFKLKLRFIALSIFISILTLSCFSVSATKTVTHSDTPHKTNEKIFVKRRNIKESTRNRIFKRDNYTCGLCGSTENLQIDHKIPFSMGGKTCFDNLQTLCLSCNTKKGNRILQ